MAVKWQKTKYPGVRFYKHQTRKHGVDFDRYYAIRYQHEGKSTEEGLGWSSAGWTAEKANEHRAELKRAARTGEGAQSLREKRQMAAQRRAEEERIALEQQRAATTFSQFFEKVYFPQAKMDKAEGSWQAEDRLYRLWIKPVIGDLPIPEISIEHLNKIKENMAGGKRAEIKTHPRDSKKEAKTAQQKRNPARPMSPRSINYAMAIIRQAWNLASAVKPPLASGAWPGAVKAFKKPKVDNHRKRFLTRNEAATLLAALKAKSKDIHDMALLSLHCGMRASEIFSLTWDKVDLAKGELLLIDTKNGGSRIAYLTDPAKEMLRQRSVICQHQRLVFTSGTGGQHKQVPATFSRTVKELDLNGGVTDSRDKIVFHSLRHTYASWLVENGASLPIVRDLMGHKNLIMTSRYSHVSAEAQKEAVAGFSRSLKPSGKNVIAINQNKPPQQ